MDEFVKGLPGKHKAEDESKPTITTAKTNTRKYDTAYLALGFTSTTVGNEERPQSAMCVKILATDSMKF